MKIQIGSRVKFVHQNSYYEGTVTSIQVDLSRTPKFLYVSVLGHECNFRVAYDQAVLVT